MIGVRMGVRIGLVESRIKDSCRRSTSQIRCSIRRLRRCQIRFGSFLRYGHEIPVSHFRAYARSHRRFRHSVAAALCTVALSGVASAQAQERGDHAAAVRRVRRDRRQRHLRLRAIADAARHRVPLGVGRAGAALLAESRRLRHQASIDTAAKTLTGQLRLRYTNHSPDTLHFVWFQVEQNAFKDTALNALVFPQHPASAPAGSTAAMSSIGSTSCAARRRASRWSRGSRGPSSKPICHRASRPAGPRHSTSRGTSRYRSTAPTAWGGMGRCTSWRSGIRASAVYDDLRGWNTEPYLGQGEFYLEYGDFNVRGHRPRRVHRGGHWLARQRARRSSLRPSARGWPRRRRRRLQSRSSHRTSCRAVRRGRKSTGTLTWRFHAHNVRDVAWAAAPNYQWDASSWHGILAQAYYRPSAAPVWKDAADMARMSIEEYSTRWYPYPYPQITALEGPDQRHGVSDARDGGSQRRRVSSSTRWSPMRSGITGSR